LGLGHIISFAKWYVGRSENVPALSLGSRFHLSVRTATTTVR
jgi:hypothetical protein